MEASNPSGALLTSLPTKECVLIKDVAFPIVKDIIVKVNIETPRAVRLW